MASAAAASKHFNNVFFSAVLAAAMGPVLISGFQFQVGEVRGWTIPTGKEPETYNEWAAKNRFHIGDTLYFKYQKDSVLVVTSADYSKCSTSNPISKYEDGNTVFQLDRPGFFYFISGQPGHCKLGQRVIVRVMHPSEVEAPELAPSPGSDGGPVGDSGWESYDWGTLGVNSTTKLFVVSYFITAFVGLFVVLYISVLDFS
ncbi:early nodulin-like protein 1 [Sesamum indicum]|uniref:Early nodulin-like protein 1 n=1 Tax=Sesamum indicum TaxID=4182 RepID=A0A6I9USN7_SESIN|nr:early nodulin-like protein 1 [Sesamum indicum]